MTTLRFAYEAALIFAIAQYTGPLDDAFAGALLEH